MKQLLSYRMPFEKISKKLMLMLMRKLEEVVHNVMHIET